MSKTLRTVALVAASVALIATGVGAFAGTTLGIATIGGGSAAVAAGAGVTAASVASVATAVAVAASVGAALTAKPPPLPGTATKFLASTSAPLPYVMGRTAVGGSVVYRRTHNTTGFTLPDLQTFAVILSAGGPINAIESFAADKVATSFSSKSAVGNYATWMFQATQLGATPEASALSTSGLFVSSGKTTSAPPGWGGGTKLSGYAAALWTLRYDAKGKDGVFKFQNGIPQPLWVIEGVKVYDPRLDSTYPGGSGSCRALNESTYVYSTNPYLHALTFALGRWQNGKRVMGIGAPIAGIDVAAFVEGANVAQANAWPVGGVIYSNGGKWGMMKAILQAGAGEPIHLGAQISCLFSTPRVTIATITTDDLVGEASVTATTPRRDRINSVIPRYRSEGHNWEMISADPVTVAAHVTTDGGLRTREIEYPLVQVLNQAAALARYDIENAREFGPIVLPVKTRWVGYKPGDCIAVTLPEVGLNGQAVVIRNRTLDPDGGVVTLTARSETNAKHAFALGQTTTAPPTPSVTAPPVAPTPGASDWAISGTGLTAGASVTPALVLTGATGDNPVDGVQFEYRLWVSGQAADVGWVDAGTAAPGSVRREITAVLPGTQYDVAVSYLLNGFAGGRRILGPVTTAGVGVPWSGVAGTGRPDDNATNGDNQIYNSGLITDTSGWSVPTGVARVAGLGTDPGSYFQFQPGALREVYPNGGAATLSPLNGSPKVHVSCWSYRLSPATGSMGIWVTFQRADGAAIGGAFVSMSPSASNVWERVSGIVDVAAVVGGVGAVSYRVHLETNVSGAVVNMASPRAATTQVAADVTALAAPDVQGNLLWELNADFAGTITSALPATRRFQAFQGNVDVSATSTWVLSSVPSTVALTVNNTSDRGLLTLGTGTTTGGLCKLTVTFPAGTVIERIITLTKTIAPAPITGGSGATSASDTTLTTVSSGSHATISDELQVRSDGANKVRISVGSAYRGAGADVQVAFKAAYATTSGGSLTDIFSEINGTTSVWDAVDNFQYQGNITLAETQYTLPAANTDYFFKLQARRVSGSGNAVFESSQFLVRQ